MSWPAFLQISESFECECVLMVDKWKGCPCVCLCLLFCLCHKRVFDGVGVEGGIIGVAVLERGCSSAHPED